jgi:hypothetical protein
MYYKSHPSAIDRNNSFAIKIEDLVREIVIQNEIPYYRIESGVDLSEAEGSEEGYMPVIRVITYFEDTVNKISHILHDEFDVDIERSTDKKKIRIETFAYKNINYTATLRKERQQQTEYKRAGDKKFEIQICSMLQDAWSGIEKELGYDNTAMPDEAKRDFYRVGALLEMADIEFLKIRTEHSKRVTNKAEEATQIYTQEVKEEIQQPVVAETIANTFAGHLQAVAKEVEPEVAPAPVAEAAPVFAPPVVAVPEVKVEVAPPPPPVVQAPVAAPVAPPVVAAPPEVSVEVAPPPPPIAQAPVAAPVAPPVVAAIPEMKVEVAPPPPVMIQLPVIETPRVAAEVQMPKMVNIGVSQPIAPQRPQAPTGVVPKPTVIPPAETTLSGIAASANINIENLKELAQSIQAEQKINMVVPPPPPPVVKQEPQPAVVIPIPPPVVEMKPAPSPEVIIPLVEKAMPDPQAPATIAAAVSNLNVTGNGTIEHVEDVIRESSVERTVPFYNESAKQTKAPQVDENAQMTDVTLREYVMNSKILKEIDQMIADRAGAKINSDVDIEGDVERLRFLKVYSLKQLHERLTDNKNDIVAFAEKWIGKDNGGSFDSGISLFYLEYLLVGKKNDPAFAVEYVVKFISDNDYSARYIIPTYNSIHNTEAPNFSHLTLKA